MSDTRPTGLVDPNGNPLRRRRARRDDSCPKCGAGPDRRENTAGFGPPVICCRNCGHQFPQKEGGTE